MRTLLLLIVFLACGCHSVQAQERAEPPASNAVYLELLGNGALYTVNYDRRFADHWSGRIGFMVVTAQAEEPVNDEVGVAILPVMVNYLAGAGSHRLELGIGPLFGIVGGELEEYGGFAGVGLAGVTTTFGYRYQPPGGGFVFRIGLTPFYSGMPQLWGGLSLGYAF